MAEEAPAGETTTEAPPAPDPNAGQAAAGTEPDETAKWKALSKKNESELRKAQKALDDLQAKNMSEQERAVAEAKAAGRQEAMSEANERLLRSEIRAAAGSKLADPSDAPALLGDLTRFIDSTGEVDTKAISSAIDDLVKKKPYLANGGRPAPLPGGGARPTPGTATPADDFAEFLGKKLSSR